MIRRDNYTQEGVSTGYGRDRGGRGPFVGGGVGRAVRVKGCSGAMAVTRVFRVRVARSLRRVRKLWTGRPSSVRPVVCLVTAAGERSALATTLERCASAASLSVSS